MVKLGYTNTLQTLSISIEDHFNSDLLTKSSVLDDQLGETTQGRPTNPEKLRPKINDNDKEKL